MIKYKSGEGVVATPGKNGLFSDGPYIIYSVILRAVKWAVISFFFFLAASFYLDVIIEFMGVEGNDYYDSNDNSDDNNCNNDDNDDKLDYGELVESL